MSRADCRKKMDAALDGVTKWAEAHPDLLVDFERDDGTWTPNEATVVVSLNALDQDYFDYSAANEDLRKIFEAAFGKAFRVVLADKRPFRPGLFLSFRSHIGSVEVEAWRKEAKARR